MKLKKTSSNDEFSRDDNIVLGHINDIINNILGYAVNRQDVNNSRELKIKVKESDVQMRLISNAPIAQYQKYTKNDNVKSKVAKKEYMDEFEKRHKYRILDNGKKRYICSICQEKHGATGNMKQHLLKHHNYVGPPKYIHKCTKCNFASGQKIGVMKHMKNVHNSKELYSKCKYCGFLGAKKAVVKEHMKVNHFYIIKTCDECDFTAKRKDDMTKHVLFAHEGIELKCKSCTFTYKSLDVMHSHRYHYHSKKSCKKCNESFQGAMSFNDHMITYHEAEKKKTRRLKNITTYHKIELGSTINKNIVNIKFVPGLEMELDSQINKNIVSIGFVPGSTI